MVWYGRCLLRIAGRRSVQVRLPSLHVPQAIMISLSHWLSVSVGCNPRHWHSGNNGVAFQSLTNGWGHALSVFAILSRRVVVAAVATNGTTTRTTRRRIPATSTTSATVMTKATAIPPRCCRCRSAKRQKRHQLALQATSARNKADL